MDMNKINREIHFFLMTSKLSQDVLENLFSIVRQKNG